MKILILAGVIFLSVVASFAQCPEPTADSLGETVGSQTFEIKKKSPLAETSLLLEASAEGASWEKKGSESAVITIFVDGKYNQDVMLFAGQAKFNYRIILGNFPAGKHSLQLVFNKSRSAKNIHRVKIYLAQIKPIPANSPEDIKAIVNAPLLYLRPDTIDKFSDIPLFTYYEILPDGGTSYKIRYTTIFTNEDGGTQTTALMARWGRATDIEWFYEIEVKNGELSSQIIQGANHVTKSFSGQRVFGSHPVIFDTTNNNNFDDRGCSALRTSLLPVRVDLSGRARETVMDENPWTYRLMAQEAMREGRVDPNNLGVNVIDDLRNYLYVEVASQNNSSSIAVEAQTLDGKISRSDFGNAKLRIERNGYQRIAIRQPSSTSPLKSLSLLCEPTLQNANAGKCENAGIIKFLKLDKNYNLLETKNSDGKLYEIKTAEKLIWTINGK